ncbi:MAG: hypothetical protein K6T49_03465 [Acidobacterium ailaaui]|nr:hypothetical protein [Pseudacidobacterium ailaaui]
MKSRLCRSAFLLALLASFALSSFAQSAPVLLHAAEAGKILPDAVFFRGQSAQVQARNSAGIKFPNGMYVLTALVDNSGYSTGIQQKYQAYFITEVPLSFSGHTLRPGAYGVGIVNGSFLVMDIAANDLFSVPATHDASIKRPTPLQLDPDGDHYRLYFGRNYVVFSSTH